MKQIIFPLILVFVCFYISPFIGLVASSAFLIYSIIHFLPNIYAIRGNRKFSDGNTADAIRLYKKAVKTNRASNKIKIFYALLLLRNGFADDAEHEFDLIARSKTASAQDKLQAKQYRCMVYCKQGRMREAMEDARELFAEHKTTTTYGMMGYFMHLTNSPLSELKELCEEAYDYNSDDRDITDNLMLALIKNGSLDRARELGTILREKHPQFVEGYYHSALLEKRSGNNTLAREYLSHIPSCKRTYLTTVSEEEIAQLTEEVSENA